MNPKLHINVTVKQSPSCSMVHASDLAKKLVVDMQPFEIMNKTNFMVNISEF